MFKISFDKYEAEKGQFIHNFAEELIQEYKKINNDIVGLINDIELRVNQYENPMSLYWQYMYKCKLRK